MVVPPRPVAPLAALLNAVPVDRVDTIDQPPAMEVAPPLEPMVVAPVSEDSPPPRPALHDEQFIDDDYLVETYEPEGKRGRWDVITVRRVLAVTTLTAALVAGSGAWVAAVSPTIEPAAAATQTTGDTDDK
jgi:hypothetical protein